MHSHPPPKINSKWISALLVNHKTIKILEDNIRGNIDDLGYDHDFLDTTIAQVMNKKISKVDFTEIKISGLWEILWSEKTKQTHRTYLQNTYLIKDLYPKHTKNFWKLTIKKLKTGKRIWTETSPKKITQIRHGGRNCSASRQWNIIHQLKRKQAFKPWKKTQSKWMLLSARSQSGDFPGRPVVKTPYSQCRGPRFNPQLGD